MRILVSLQLNSLADFADVLWSRLLSPHFLDDSCLFSQRPQRNSGMGQRTQRKEGEERWCFVISDSTQNCTPQPATPPLLLEAGGSQSVSRLPTYFYSVRSCFSFPGFQSLSKWENSLHPCRHQLCCKEGFLVQLKPAKQNRLTADLEVRGRAAASLAVWMRFLEMGWILDILSSWWLIYTGTKAKTKLWWS